MDIEPKSVSLFAERVIRAGWNSAFRSMDLWATKANENIPPNMIKLAHEARYFINKYRAFFSQVVFEPEEKDEFNQTLVLYHALEVALQEWDTIRHALEQRENSRYQRVLPELDALSIECLSPLFGAEKIERDGVYTYIHKLFDIKRFAFSRTPLIGAPYEALNAPESWLAIPHEAGHYIFWNGTNTFDSFNRFYLTLQDSLLHAIETALQGRIKGAYFRRKGEVIQTWLNWLDEIFADIFGTLVAGPAFAWSMQSSLRAPLSIRDLYHSHDGPDHPNPFIRPFFHIQTLREMAKASKGEFSDHLKAEADSLEISWKKSWFTADEDIDKLPTPDNIGTMTDVLENEVPLVVSAILSTGLGENLPKTLIQYFMEGKFYNPARHSDVMEIANQINAKEEVQVTSPLLKSAGAQMAIVLGAEPVYVHQVLGYGGAEESLEVDKDLDVRFSEFVGNVTGQDDPQQQLAAWRRVLDYSLVEQAFGGHHHQHKH